MSMKTKRAKRSKLSFEAAEHLYKKVYPLDNYTLTRCKENTKMAANERNALRTEITNFLNAPTLKDACLLAKEYDYGTLSGGNDWTDYEEDMAALRSFVGIKDELLFDCSPRSIIKDLIGLLVDNVGKTEALIDLECVKNLDKRIEKVYGRVWEETIDVDFRRNDRK